MLSIRHFVQTTLAAGVLVAGVSTASAQDWRNYQPYRPSYPYQNQYRDYNNRYDRFEELQEHMDHDRANLDEAIRSGSDAEAARQAADLAQDQRLQQDRTRALGTESYYGSYNNRGYHNRGWFFSWGRR